MNRIISFSNCVDDEDKEFGYNRKLRKQGKEQFKGNLKLYRGTRKGTPLSHLQSKKEKESS